MAYFKQNEPEETRRNSTVSPEQEYDAEYAPEESRGNVPFSDQPYAAYDDDGPVYDDDGYDDGFDEPADYTEEELSEEEKQAQKRDRIQMLFGAGDLTGIIAGTIVILLLVAFLFQMINFVRDDIHEFFDTIGRFFM